MSFKTCNSHVQHKVFGLELLGWLDGQIEVWCNVGCIICTTEKYVYSVVQCNMYNSVLTGLSTCSVAQYGPNWV